MGAVDTVLPAGPAPVHAADELLVGFARALRAAGVAVTMDRTQSFLEAVATVGLGDRRATYWAGRATLCSGPDDLDRYDEIFSAWFLDTEKPRPRSTPPDQPPASQASLEEVETQGGPA